MSIQERFSGIYTSKETRRIHVNETVTGISVVVDVHGMTCSQAKRFINNLINVARCPFILTVIHGYNHGTAILRMVRNELDNQHITRRFLDQYNQGVTYLAIA